MVIHLQVMKEGVVLKKIQFNIITFEIWDKNPSFIIISWPKVTKVKSIFYKKIL